ncbi:hypothetical protein N7532_005642 [Penicillium argentinense]|uniref:Uncharacterized protein n=1 Tax=Penicillium argentinense TaxID=1131581 RepID=A0A9W9KAK2_9EURO|nr:uncharacterized protein N7532_005642 [Penicillium argentinense]KAJ5098641.1 hypothetical protein N7532_005642 [Penicillium argentinense]
MSAASVSVSRWDRGTHVVQRHALSHLFLDIFGLVKIVGLHAQFLLHVVRPVELGRPEEVVNGGVLQYASRYHLINKSELKDGTNSVEEDRQEALGILLQPFESVQHRRLGFAVIVLAATVGRGATEVLLSGGERLFEVIAVLSVV